MSTVDLYVNLNNWKVLIVNTKPQEFRHPYICQVTDELYKVKLTFKKLAVKLLSEQHI